MRRRILPSARPAKQNMAGNRYLLEGKPGPTGRIFKMDRNREPKAAAPVLLPTWSGTTGSACPPRHSILCPGGAAPNFCGGTAPGAF